MYNAPGPRPKVEEQCTNLEMQHAPFVLKLSASAMEHRKIRSEYETLGENEAIKWPWSPGNKTWAELTGSVDAVWSHYAHLASLGFGDFLARPSLDALIQSNAVLDAVAVDPETMKTQPSRKNK